MAGARMVEVDYYKLRRLLRDAGNAGGRIEKRDAGRWQAYVAEHKLNEVAATSIARSHFESPVAVIVNMGGKDDGLYLYSDIEESALCLVMRD